MTFQSNHGDYPTGLFYPFVCGISAISPQGAKTLVTTSINHQFVVGNQVFFQIPPQWGMRQLNGLTSYVSAIPAPNQITVVLNTSTFDPFVVPTPGPFIVIDPAMVLPSGNQNTGQLYAGGVPLLPIEIPGAYNVTEFPNV
jgi:hypothetical protein